MREFRTYGSVGEAPGNRCLYPEFDGHFSIFLPTRNSKRLAKNREVFQNQTILLVCENACHSD